MPKPALCSGLGVERPGDCAGQGNLVLSVIASMCIHCCVCWCIVLERTATEMLVEQLSPERLQQRSTREFVPRRHDLVPFRTVAIRDLLPDSTE